MTCYYVVLPSWIKVCDTSHQIIDSLSIKGSATTSEQLVCEQIYRQYPERIQVVIEHFTVLDWYYVYRNSECLTVNLNSWLPRKLVFRLIMGARHFPSRRATGCDCHVEDPPEGCGAI